MEATQTHTAPPPTRAAISPRPILWWVGTFGGAFLACVLLFAVWAKAIDPPSFVDQIHTEGLDFLLPARAVALIALALEAGLGLLLLLGVRRKWVLIPATLPWIFTGMRIAVRYAFTNTLLAELIASNSGIGFMIEYYSGVFDATGTYAAILVLVIMSVGLTELLTMIETRLSHRGATA